LNAPQLPTAVAKGGRYALVLLALTQAMSLLDRQILAILAPAIKKDLGVGDAEMGLLYGTVFALFYALFSLPVGRLADGWVRTRLLAISLLFWSAATGLAGLTTSFAMLALSRLGVGIGEAATSPAGTSLLYDYWPRQQRGFVMAVMASAIALGLGGSLILGGLAANWWDVAHPGAALRGWQFAFLVAAAPGFVLAAFLWTLREPTRGVMDGIATPPDPRPFAASLEMLGAVTPGFHLIVMRARADRAQSCAGGHDRRGHGHAGCGVHRNLAAPAAGVRQRGRQSACAAMGGDRAGSAGDRQSRAEREPVRSPSQPSAARLADSDHVHGGRHAAIGAQLRDDGLQPDLPDPHVPPFAG
jgi:hypothetical protein